MKSVNLLIIIIVLALSGLSTQAQPQLWGMGPCGGTYSFDDGAIYKINLDGSGYSTPFCFDSIDGQNPFGSVIQATNGLLYGFASLGGANELGVFFSFDPATNNYVDILDFDGPNYGEVPEEGVIQASNGKLYGLVGQGGANGDGVLFSYDISTNIFTNLYNFIDTIGKFPWACLLEASDGKLYGLTNEGGLWGYGVIFDFDTTSNTYTKLFDFDSVTTGNQQYGNLIQAANGKLYGMSELGGANGDGVLFSFDIATNTDSVLFNFDGTNGSSPGGSLIQASNGLLYGMAELGGIYNLGVLFSFDTASNTYSVLINFNGTHNGSHPTGSLIQDPTTGKLYGFTFDGGIYGMGIIFSYDIMDSTLTKLRDLDTPDAVYPLFSSLFESFTTGIPVINTSETNICVYPNPANTFITISQDVYTPNQELLITDVLGRQIYKQVITDINTIIDVSKWSEGVYFYELSSNNNISRGKFVVQK